MLPAATVARSVRVNGLAGAARLAMDQAAYDEAAERCAQALTLARELEDPRMLVAALNTEGLLAGRRTDTPIPDALIRRHRSQWRWRWDLNPRKGCPFTRFRVLRTTVHHRPPVFLTSADSRPVAAREPP